jgi:hypothetical protein
MNVHVIRNPLHGENMEHFLSIQVARDRDVFICEVGRSHPLKAEAQNFFLDSSKRSKISASAISS